MVFKKNRVIGTLSAIALLSTVAACGSGSDSGDAGASGDGSQAKLTFVGYGGDGQDAMIEQWQKPFTKLNPGVTFTNTSPTDVAQVKAQVQSNSVSWDVVATSPAAAEQNCGTLFEPLKITGVEAEKDLVKQAIGKCYTGNFINATPFAYRTDAFPDPSKAPKTIEDFFDTKKFPGQRGLVNNLQNGILEYPLLADGVAPDDLYPLDVDRALDKLSSIRKVTTFAPNVGALQQAVGAKQVDLFALPDSRLTALMDEGTDVTIVWDVTVTSINAFAVPKGSKNLKAAEKFMAFVLGPVASANISQTLGTAPINNAAQPKLSESAKKVEVNGPLNTGETVQQDVDWYAKNFNDVSTKLTNWLVG
jgi:putative spermidine/putrescine transport system substrate-binding protein